eukprot:252395-Karenia_brevis.AAC.1
MALDDILEERALHDVKTQFWHRRKLRFPVELMPSDLVVSRCAPPGSRTSVFSQCSTSGQSSRSCNKS